MLPRNLRQYSNRKVFIALGGIIGLSLATTAATTLALSALLIYRQGAQNYNDSRVQIEGLLTELYRVSMFEREFLLTGKPADAAAYRQISATLPDQVTKVEQALAPDSIDQIIPKIRPLVQSLMDEQDRVVAQAEAGDSAGALAAQQSGTEPQLTGAISALTSQIQQGDVNQLVTDRNRINFLAMLARNINIASLLLTLVLAILIYWLYLKAIQAERVLDKAKDEFVSLASHQLRTPATGIKSILATLVSGDVGPLNPRQEYFTRKALEANERGLQIIEDLLNVAKADAGRLVMNASKFNVQQTVADVIAEQRPAIEAKHITLRIHQPDSPLELTADQDKLYMALGNLLDNACKYTPESGSVTVDVHRKGNDVRFIVSDTGIGINSGDIKHIFDRFQRSGDTERVHSEGTGLGLYLVRSIVDLHGGSVKAISRKGKGAKFVMIIPQGSRL